jgi:type III restriction enzyme
LRLQFDGNQSFQLHAIESVADLLQGQPRRLVDFAAVDLGPMFGSITNRLDLSEDQLVRNLHIVQDRNGISLDQGLQWIEETIRTVGGDQPIRFANFSVEMETGTGKTYVYLRTALELNRRYGLRKFIVVVPSVAVREGVIKTLKITQDHLYTTMCRIVTRYTTRKASPR